MRMHTSPSRWSKPNTGGLSPARVPRPRLPFNRRLRPFRPAFRTSAGSPLCPATIYTSSASISPLSWTGFFSPQFLDAVGWSSSGHRPLQDPTPQQSVRSKGSNPSSTDTTPRPATVDDVLQRSCHSDHRIVAHSLTLIPLPMSLMRMITTFLDHTRPTLRTAYAVRPAQFSNHRKAFCVIDQLLEVDHASILSDPVHLLETR